MDFLKTKGTTNEILSLVKGSTMLNANELRKIDVKTLDFTKHSKEYQLFFFENTCAKVTAQGVELITKSKIENYVFENNIIKTFFPEARQIILEPYTDNKGTKRVHITETSVIL